MNSKFDLCCHVGLHENLKEYMVSIAFDIGKSTYFGSLDLTRGFREHDCNFKTFRRYEGQISLIALKSFLFFNCLQKKILNLKNAK